MIKRNSYLEQLDKQKNIPLIKVLTGIRKCGKSTILNMFMDQFNGNDNVIYIDFNNLTYSSKIKNYLELNSYIEKRIKNNKKNFIIIDEVQEIDNFQKTINSLSLKRNNDIYITGSNSKLLSSEMSTLITGKNVKINI
jgi:predicted AAA+ superfamily ATPase